MSDQHQIIEISQEPIPLCQLLKIANLVSGGGEAKIVISEGYVLLNDEVEYQKRKKVYADDIIEFNGETVQVVVNNLPKIKNKVIKIPAVVETKTKKTNKKNAPQKMKEVAEPTEAFTEKSTKRKPISF